MATPARKIKSSTVKNLFKFPSTKTPPYESSLTPYKMVLVESALEKDFCYHLEADSDVSEYYPQPRTFTSPKGEIPKWSYTPDFIVIFKDGVSVYVEVKRSVDELKEIYWYKLGRVAELLRVEKSTLVVADAELIRAPETLHDLKIAHRYRSRNAKISPKGVQVPAPIDLPERIADLCARLPQELVGSVRDYVSKSAVTPVLLHIQSS
ncbi:hypothetical protein [Gilvimarinus algae]|uniref:TnsA endonuclease N-terminal domain-containing protein n=1 Tax=Gilvimarinus algae TaxID=3058037 RepID=A0ABT8TAG3_9GAMM|nr:hypothetical protein [Gilvimarinus sp. SDUM040014]MDO3380895.1 hypothetical protein [Gilvimarinus sp. SDUM040014]